MPVDITDWTGLIRGTRSDSHELRLVTALEASKSGGSGSFRGLGDDGHQYFVKTVNNAQGVKVPVTEQIVGRAAALIQGSACVVRTIMIPNELRGWQFQPSRTLEPGIAHASLALENCFETRQLSYRAEDDNARRHAAFLALYDWCWGGDSQWLVSQAEEHRYYSHDHGWFLPPEGPAWTSDSLLANVDSEHSWPDGYNGFKRQDLEEIAVSLESVTRDVLAAALRLVPISWAVTDEELEHVGYFLERRAPQVAARLRARIGGLTS
jgi:hypothetical protein